MNLSAHFTLSEFCSSQTAARMGRTIDPTSEQVANATRLCELVLEPLRTQLGRSIVITSGIRPAWLNSAIGGAANSAHITGRAADIHAVGMHPEVLARWIRRQDSPVDRCILEFPTSSGGGWVHVQIASGTNKPRQQYLLASVVNGSTFYGALPA